MEVKVTIELAGKRVEFSCVDHADIEHARLMTILQLNAAIEKLVTARQLREMKCAQAMYSATHATQVMDDYDDTCREYM